MKNKLTRKLMLSAFTLLFAVISLGASTYAWFVLSENAYVKPFEGTVTSGASGLAIGVGAPDSTAPVQWHATEFDIADDLASIFKDFRFDAVQNADPLNNGTFNILDVTKDDYKGAEATPNGKDGKYLSFKLYFKLTDTNNETSDKEVCLESYSMLTNPVEGSKIHGDVDYWKVNRVYQNANGADVALTKNEENGVKYYVSDAARIAILCDESTNAKSLLLETNNYAGADGFKSSGATNNGALSYYNAVNQTLYTVPEGYANPQYGAEVIDEKLKIYDGNTVVCTLSKTNYESSITVNIWIDGWDGECINAIFGQKLVIDFKFSFKKVNVGE